MFNLKTLSIMISMAILMTINACSISNNNDVSRPLIVVAVMTAITESEELTRQDVLDAVQEFRLRANLDGQITASELLLTADLVFDFDRLEPRIRFALSEALIHAERAITAEGMRPEEVKGTAEQLLSWVELAANLATEE